MKKVKLYLNYAGHCFAHENQVIQGGRKEKIKFYALWGLIEHPEKGWILYDTGYTERFFHATKSYPNMIYAKMTRVVVDPNDEIKSQLVRNAISPKDIKHVFITHFHADHVAGLLDFPEAKIYTSRAALDQVLKIPRAIAFSKGILKSLIPDDLKERAILVEDMCHPIQDPILGLKYDLFGDKSIYVVPLPGHAAGQFGILLETENNPYFLIADACWLKKSYEEMVLPSPVVKLFFHSWSDFKRSLKIVHDYHNENPETIIVPTHCAETTDVLVSEKFNMDVL